MGQPIPAQHPSVVLRSHFKLVKGLLAVAMVAVLALTAAVVILANDEDKVNTASKAAPQVSSRGTAAAGTRFDGGPEEGTRGSRSRRRSPQPGTRFDGGPEEGTRGLQGAAAAAPGTPLRRRPRGGHPRPAVDYEQPGARTSYQPAPADSFKERAGGPRMIPQGPSPR